MHTLKGGDQHCDAECDDDFLAFGEITCGAAETASKAAGCIGSTISAAITSAFSYVVTLCSDVLSALAKSMATVFSLHSMNFKLDYSSKTANTKKLSFYTRYRSFGKEYRKTFNLDLSSTSAFLKSVAKSLFMDKCGAGEKCDDYPDRKRRDGIDYFDILHGQTNFTERVSRVRRGSREESHAQYMATLSPGSRERREFNALVHELVVDLVSKVALLILFRQLTMKPAATCRRNLSS